MLAERTALQIEQINSWCMRKRVTAGYKIRDVRLSVSLHGRDNVLNNEHEFLDYFDPPAVVARRLGTLRPARPHEEGFNRLTKVVGVMKQHRIRFGQAPADVLRHACAESFLDRTILDLGFRSSTDEMP